MKRVVSDRQRLWWGVNADAPLRDDGVFVDVVRDRDCEKTSDSCKSRSLADVPLALGLDLGT